MNDNHWMQDEMQERRLRHRLAVQSGHIERVFARHRLYAQVTGGKAERAVTRFDLWSQLGNGLEKLRIASSDIRKALGASAVEVDGREGRYQLRLESDMEPQISLLDSLPLVPKWPGATAMLGLNEKGAPVLTDFRNRNTAHMLITGDVGSGKSSLLRTMAVSLSLVYRQSQVQLMFIAESSKLRHECLLEPLQYLPHMLAPVAREPNEAVDVLSFLTDEMAYRKQQQILTPAIILMVDEVVGLTQIGDAALVDMLTQLAQRGPNVGIHLVLTSEYPELEPLDTLFKSNLPVRIVGKTESDRRIGAAAGNQEPLVSYVSGPGEFVAVIDGSRPTMFQAAYVSDYDLHLSLQEMQRSRPRPILARPVQLKELLYGREKLDEPKTLHDSGFTYDGLDVALSNEADVYDDFLDGDACFDEVSFEEE